MSKPHFRKGRAYWLCYDRGQMGSGKTLNTAYLSLLRKIEWEEHKARQREESRIFDDKVRQEKERILTSLESDPHGRRSLTTKEFEEIHPRRERYLHNFGRYPDKELVAGWVAYLRVYDSEKKLLDRIPAKQ